MVLRTVLVLAYVAILLYLSRRPSFLFAFGAALVSLPVIGLLGIENLVTPVFERAVFEAFLLSTAQVAVLAWLVLNADRYVRERSEYEIVGKWTTVSGVSGFLLVYYINFFQSYSETLPVEVLVQSPYTTVLLEVWEVAVPLLLVGATWHPSRMVFYVLANVIRHPTARLVKWLPYGLLLVMVFSALSYPFSTGVEWNLSATVDYFVLMLPAVVSVGASVREYNQYGLAFQRPVGKSRVTDAIYGVLLRQNVSLPVAGVCFGLWGSLLNARLGVYATMEPFRFYLGIILIPLGFRLMAWLLEEFVLQGFRQNTILFENE